jgi:predicted Zn-dependent protease
MDETAQVTPLFPADRLARTGQPAADELLAAMDRELRRSMRGLRVPDAPRPYYLQYALRRAHGLDLRAAFGSLLRDRERTHGQIFVDVRVGDYRFDNVLDGGLETQAEERDSADWVDAPDDLEPQALGVALWKLSQLKFDEALQDYYDHRKALVTEFMRDDVDAFTREPPTVHVEPLTELRFPREAWGTALREASRRFLRHPELHDPYIQLHAERIQRWMVDSEGTRVVTQDVYVEVSVGGWILTEDGVYSEASRRELARRIDGHPIHGDWSGPALRARLERAIDEVIAELAALGRAATPGSLIGPALLSGQAAATLFHEALGHRLEGERRIARGETRTFAQKVGERILPRGLDVVDDPTLTEIAGEPAWGHYRVDDQGVPAQRAELVRDGVLVGFLRSRTPIPDGRGSNGHGRHDGLQPPMARMGNLIVEARPEHALPQAELERRLIALAKAQGHRHAIVIERIHAGETTTGSYDFEGFKGEPSEVYQLDVETGVRIRVRDVSLIGTPLSALQRIVAFGRDAQADHGYCVAESGSVPVSGCAPAILLSELELQQESTSGYHEPLLPPPFAVVEPEDGPARRRRRRVRRRERGSGPA